MEAKNIEDTCREGTDVDAAEFDRQHRLDEMSTISRPNDCLPRCCRVVVYAEGDEQGTKTPHFHVILEHGKIELEVMFQHVQQMNIWRVKGGHEKSWDGIRDVRIRLVEWLDEKPARYLGCSNLQVMVLCWNVANPTNEIDLQYCQ